MGHNDDRLSMSLDDLIKAKNRKPHHNDSEHNRRSRQWNRDPYPPSHSRQRQPEVHLNSNSNNSRYSENFSSRLSRRDHVVANRDSDFKIFVDNLHSSITEDELQELFEDIDRNAVVECFYTREGRSSGCAVVTFPSLQAAMTAKEKNQDKELIIGRPIKISLLNFSSQKNSSVFQRIGGGERRKRTPDVEEVENSSDDMEVMEGPCDAKKMKSFHQDEDSPPEDSGWNDTLFLSPINLALSAKQVDA